LHDAEEVMRRKRAEPHLKHIDLQVMSSGRRRGVGGLGLAALAYR
jgi:hypothetical protein